MPKNTKQGEERRGMVKKTCVSVKELCNRFSQKKKKKKRSHLLLDRNSERVKEKEQKGQKQRKKGTE